MSFNTFANVAARAANIGGMSDVHIAFTNACVAFGESMIRERKAWYAMQEAEFALANAFGIAIADYDSVFANDALADLTRALNESECDHAAWITRCAALDEWLKRSEEESENRKEMMSYSSIVS